MRRFAVVSFAILLGVSAREGLAVDVAAPTAWPDRPVDTSPLLEIEQRCLPPVLQSGRNRYPDLPAYYMAENVALRERFDAVRRAFENGGGPRPLRCVTLIAGAAGVGKTFIKGEVFSKSYPKEEVCKFDIRELYEQWREAGYTEERPDLQAGAGCASRCSGST
ncbi:MAG: hypothetical protein JJ992_21915, partial [Planctomycetes bacterium]|nr:hypothetical protein [Planctomycetota bacterium]